MNPFDLFKAGGDLMNSYRPATKKTFGTWMYNNSANGRDISDVTSYKFDTSDAQGQFDAQRYDSHNALQIRVRDALKAGLNPLAALGAGSSHYSPTISSGGDSGSGNMISDSISNVGRSISDMILNRQARQDRAIALESANLDLESKRLQNDILRQQLLSAVQPGIVSSRGDAPKNLSWRIPMDYNLRDVEPGDLFLPWKDLRGNVHWFINPDAISDADYSNIEADRAMAIGAVGISRGVKKSWRRNRKKITMDTVNALW